MLPAIPAFAAAAAERGRWIEDTLRELVLIESPTDLPTAVNRAQAFVASLAQAFGARTEVIEQTAFGDLYTHHFGSPSSTQKPLLLLGHLDTVWPLGTLSSMPWRQDTGRIYGPGVLDMKSGVVMALAALAILRELDLDRPIIFLLNSEEEVGSPVSRPLTEQLARAAAAVFVLEPAQGLAYKTARKGVGQFDLHVRGVAAHSGVDFDRGHSAILEAARLVERVSAFTNPDLGRTVNCGVIAGGTRSNVVAATCTVEVDVRITTADDASAVTQLFATLCPSDPACTLTVTGGINRPPMERGPGSITLFEQARTLAAQLGQDMGFTLDEAATGGASDGNFTAALGIPTLDGMGGVGEGAHARHESILVEHLVPRTALLAAMLATC